MRGGKAHPLVDFVARFNADSIAPVLDSVVKEFEGRCTWPFHGARPAARDIKRARAVVGSWFQMCTRPVHARSAISTKAQLLAALAIAHAPRDGRRASRPFARDFAPTRAVASGPLRAPKKAQAAPKVHPNGWRTRGAQAAAVQVRLQGNSRREQSASLRTRLEQNRRRAMGKLVTEWRWLCTRRRSRASRPRRRSRPALLPG